MESIGRANVASAGNLVKHRSGGPIMTIDVTPPEGMCETPPIIWTFGGKAKLFPAHARQSREPTAHVTNVTISSLTFRSHFWPFLKSTKKTTDRVVGCFPFSPMMISDILFFNGKHRRSAISAKMPQAHFALLSRCSGVSGARVRANEPDLASSTSIFHAGLVLVAPVLF
jgi:hypothetical protein